MATVVARANFKEHWHKPPTAVYNDNYGYAINYYQPMIDYLDLKRDDNLKEEELEPPHLPWSNERGLPKFRPGNVVKSYSKGDLVKFAVEAEHKAKENLQHFKPAKRTDLTLSGTVKASKVVQEVVKESKVKKLDKQIHGKIMEAVAAIDGLDLATTGAGQALRNLEEHSALRCAKEISYQKSAKAIEAELLNEAFQNLSANTGIDIKSFQRRAKSAAHDHLEHTILMNSRQKQILEDESNFNKPLGELKTELDNFKKTTDNYFLDNR